MDSNQKRRPPIKSHPQNRPFIALGSIATSFDMGAGMLAEYMAGQKDWD